MTVKCGNCKSTHSTAAAVKECYTTYKNERPSERAMRIASREAGWERHAEATMRKDVVESLLKESDAEVPAIQPDPEELEAERGHTVTMPSVQTQLAEMPKPKRSPVPAHLKREDKQGGLRFTDIGISNMEGDRVMDGRYAVVMDGEQVTLRFHTPAIGKFRGVQLVTYLYGPDNTESGDWVRMANHVGNGYRVWGRYINSTRLVNALRFMSGASVDELIGCGEAYALQSNNCWRCGRDLTREESIVRGMGPVCAEKVMG